MTKKILIASFIFKDRMKWFLEFLKTEFNIPRNEVFVYENRDNDNQLLFTFYITLLNGEKIDVRNTFNSAIIVHKKKGVYYTINALNRIIELESEVELGNIDYKDIKINWEKYRNNLVLLADNNLILIPLKRVFY